jgi:BMFP domain-containing protein YqiC
MAARGSSRALLDAFEELVAELPSRVRGSRERLSEGALSLLQVVVEELDLVTRDELDEVELRVAQLEHRLRLLEGPPNLPPAPPPPSPPPAA